jgi:hypothetical protein
LNRPTIFAKNAGSDKEPNALAREAKLSKSRSMPIISIMILGILAQSSLLSVQDVISKQTLSYEAETDAGPNFVRNDSP